MNGNVTLASGHAVHRARARRHSATSARGTNGTLRANYNGQPIERRRSDVAAVLQHRRVLGSGAGHVRQRRPQHDHRPGHLGDEPGADAATSRSSQTRGLSIQLLASNVFNTVQFASIDTVVNSPTFGQVIAVRPMRRMQLLMRLRF